MNDSQEQPQTDVFNLFEAAGLDKRASLEHRLFDPQICGEIQEDFLVNAVEHHGISGSELKSMIAGKLLRHCKNKAGREGFLLYAEQQARVAKKLQATGRYSVAELQHILAGWNDFLEILSADVFAYEDMDVDNYEHFRRRSRELTDAFAGETRTFLD
jgi:hypothetical protein